jgi:ABC-2 type transport system ATP-binding protein
MGDTAQTGREPTAAAGTDESETAGETATDHPDREGQPPALAVEGVSKQFGEGETAVVAVDDVSFAVEQGSVVGLLGPNGAGKTTLIKCALGMVLPDSGTVRVFGTEVKEGRRGVYSDVDAMLEGARNDYWRLTVRENLRYFATISGVDPDSVSERHERLLERLDLVEQADTPVRNLSRGMKQKVSLASVLAGGARLVVLDEPTLGLDVESSRTLRAELRRLAREEGLTILLSSHDMRTIEAVCDRVIMLSNGRVVADDTVEGLLDRADRGIVRVTSPDIDDSLLRTLDERFGLLSVDAVANGRRVELTADGDRFYDLVDCLREAGATVDDIRTVEPDLEDVLLGLTGDDGDDPTGQTALANRTNGDGVDAR